MLIFCSARGISIPESGICSLATPAFQFGRNHIHLMIARVDDTDWRDGYVSIRITRRTRSFSGQDNLFNAIHALDLLDELVNLGLENGPAKRPAEVFCIAGGGNRPQKSVERFDDLLT